MQYVYALTEFDLMASFPINIGIATGVDTGWGFKLPVDRRRSSVIRPRHRMKRRRAGDAPPQISGPVGDIITLGGGGARPRGRANNAQPASGSTTIFHSNR
ncbi:hypothetical protein EVAR_69782_1 [Eumeta japonica]|uniref:Uncharacterized protein n=1 Tax=Eumeta variegata TaxID=151549 RepID=A0A4C2A3M2_EUMVA|nr:hypothetical protein EVAR_69782_1 [Eumeta japonica]